MRNFETTWLHKRVERIIGQLLGPSSRYWGIANKGPITATFIFIASFALFTLLTPFWYSFPLPPWLAWSGLILTTTGFYGFVMWYTWYLTKDFFQHDFKWNAYTSSIVGLVICLAITINVVSYVYPLLQAFVFM